MPGSARSLPESARSQGGRAVRCAGYPHPGTTAEPPPGPYRDGDDHGSAPATTGELRPTPMDRIRRSGPGTMLGAAMLGLAEVVEGRPRREEITIVSEAPDEPFRRVELRLDPVNKERSLVVVHSRVQPAPRAGNADPGDT